MRKLRYNVSMTLVVLGLSALAACSKPAAPAGDAASSGAAAASGTPAAATVKGGSVADLGQGLKTGVWELTTHAAGSPRAMVAKMCIDTAMSTQFAKLGSSMAAQMDCTTTKASRSGNVIDTESVCKEKGRTIKTQMHMELTADGYHQTMQSSYDPPSRPPVSAEVDGKYLGDCGDMKPGDMVLPGGIKINMNSGLAKAKTP
ncbi:MAG TPA: DUF3617 family protein [Asticcacaulis sp.]|nr:DUF3617 family protein [Asticcacaulis sp.]